MIIPVFLVLFGIWMMALAIMRASSPQKYEQGWFGAMSLGLLLIAIGGAWFLFTFNWLYSVVLILFVFGALAIVAALKRKCPFERLCSKHFFMSLHSLLSEGNGYE